MTRDRLKLRRDLQHVCPTLSPDDISLIIECLGYELLGRGIWQGTRCLEVATELIGVRDRTPDPVSLATRAS